jgi:hypothetical protein
MVVFMALKDVTDRRAIEEAVIEFDDLGRQAFLKKYGFRQAGQYFLVKAGRLYDSKAIVGAAHGFQFPDQGPLRAHQFSGGEKTVKRKLEDLGFTVRSHQEELGPLVLVENETTVGGEYDYWEDRTGTQYHFPNQYRKKVIEGRSFAYYRGVRKSDGTRRETPEYFGCGRIGSVRRDPSVPDNAPKKSWKFYCDIHDYVEFPLPVGWKRDGVLFEPISQNFSSIFNRLG